MVGVHTQTTFLYFVHSIWSALCFLQYLLLQSNNHMIHSLFVGDSFVLSVCRWMVVWLDSCPPSFRSRLQTVGLHFAVDEPRPQPDLLLPDSCVSAGGSRLCPAGMMSVAVAEGCFLSALQPNSSCTAYVVPSDGPSPDPVAKARRVREQVRMRLAEKKSSSLPRLDDSLVGSTGESRHGKKPSK